MRITVLIVLAVLFSQSSFGQSRKYVLKVTKVYTASDKAKAATELIAEAKKDLKESDYDYFYCLNSAASALFNVNNIQALKYNEDARELFKAHHLSYRDPITPDLGPNFVQTLSMMWSLHSSLGTIDAVVPILVSDGEFIRSLSAAAQCEYFLLLSGVYTMTGRIDKAEESLTEVKLILDSKTSLVPPSQQTDKRSLEFHRQYVESAHHSMEIRYNSAFAQLMTKKGNSHAYDSIQSKITDDTQRLRSSVISERVQKKIERKNERMNNLFKNFYGVPLDSVNKINFAQHFGPQPLPSQEPKGYLYNIPYHLRQKNFSKSAQLIAEARQELDNYVRKRSDSIITSIYRGSLDEVEATYHASQGNYEKRISIRSKPMKAMEQTFNEALPYLSENELRSFFNKYQEVTGQYLSALSFAAPQPDAVRIFEKSAATRGLLLSLSKERSRIALTAATGPARQQIEQLKHFRNRMNFFSQQAHLSGNDSDLDSIQMYESKIARSQRDLNTRLGVTVNAGRPYQWKEIQSRLKPGECLVYIQLLPREYFDPGYANASRTTPEYWFIIFDHQSPSPALVKIGDAAVLERAFRYYQNSIKSTIDDRLSYDALWKPIAAKTSQQRRIYLSADGLYHLLNPYTLLNPATNQFVLGETELIRVNDLRSFTGNKSTQSVAPEKMVFVGNPDFSLNRRNDTSKKTTRYDSPATPDSLTRSGFMQLPGAEQEVEGASRQAVNKGLDVTLLTGGKATELNVKRIENPTVYHFATHGIFETGSSYDAFLRSKLVLAGVNDGNTFTSEDHSKYEDGWLTAYEVTQLNLQQTRLVILSACQTAQGDVKASDGVYGVQRAFQVAGAKYVLGSLWPINDQATAVLMTAFYEHYFKTQDILASYRHAMIVTKEKFPHPNYWGSFILSGTE